jgi:hypothetical protein
MAGSYFVWDVDEEEETAREIPAVGTPNLGWWEVAGDADDAAARWAEQRWADLDHPEEMSCFVKSPDGAVTRWKVGVEHTVVFNASKEEVENG